MKKNVPTLMEVKAHFKYYYKMVELDISEVLEKKVVEYVYNLCYISDNEINFLLLIYSKLEHVTNRLEYIYLS